MALSRVITKVTTGLLVGGSAWLFSTANAMAQTDASAPPTPLAATATCPLPGSFGNGTPASADAAYTALTPSPASAATSTPSTGLAFTGGNFAQEAAAGGLLVAAGGFVVWRSRRRPLAAVDGPDDGNSFAP